MGKKVNQKLVVWIIIFVILILVSLFATAKLINSSRGEEETIAPIPYYPNENMVKIFKNNSEDVGFTQIVDMVKQGKIQIKQVDLLTRVVMVYDISADYIKLIYTEEVANNEFKEDYIESLIPNRMDIVLKAPIEIGTNWEDNDGGIYEIIKINAIVDTPAGTFETVVVRYTNDDFTVKEYYAKNIGLVKIIFNNYGVYELIQISK